MDGEIYDDFVTSVRKMRPVTEKELDVFELELAIKWAHAATLMDKNPEVSYLFSLSETALREKLERLNSAPPPNDPLTMEELREMDGEPVWDKAGNCFIIRINVHGTDGYGADKFATYTKLDILCERGLYRNKPEEDNE